MARLWLLKPQWLVFIPVMLLLAIAVACGDDATPVPPPAFATAAEIKALVDSAVSSAIAGGVTKEDVGSLVSKAITDAQAAAPKPLTAAEVGQIVQNAVAAAAPTPTVPAMKKLEGTINIAYKTLGPGPFDAHPRLGSGSTVKFAANTIAERLVTVSAQGEYQPKLVREWTLSADSLIWTFKFQEGVQFHKGYGELTTEDVVWSFTEYVAAGTLAVKPDVYERLFFNPEGGMKVIDGHTLEVDTGTLQYDMLLQISIPEAGNIMSKKQVDDVGEEEANRNGAGTGSWEIHEVESGTFFKFKAVENHWRKTPNFAELVFWEIPEESTRVANFQVGKLDSFTMEFDSLPVVKDVIDTKFMRVNGGSVERLALFGQWHVGVGTDKQAPGYDPDLPWVSGNPDVESDEWKRAVKVRQALFISVDRQLIVDTLLKGEGVPLVLTGWEDNVHRLPSEKQQWEFNPAKARQLLVEAGYPNGFKIDVTPSIRNVPGEVEACQAIATMYKDIGIDAQPKNIPWPTIRPIIISKNLIGANCHGGSGRFDPLGLYTIIVSSKGGFTGGFTHPWLDEKIALGLSKVDTDERYELLVEIGTFIYDNALSSGLYSVNLLWPLSSKIDAWTEHLEFGDRRDLSAYEYIPHR